eukprot:Pgem_evm1s10987
MRHGGIRQPLVRTCNAQYPKYKQKYNFEKDRGQRAINRQFSERVKPKKDRAE